MICAWRGRGCSERRVRSPSRRSARHRRRARRRRTTCGVCVWSLRLHLLISCSFCGWTWCARRSRERARRSACSVCRRERSPRGGGGGHVLRARLRDEGRWGRGGRGARAGTSRWPRWGRLPAASRSVRDRARSRVATMCVDAGPNNKVGGQIRRLAGVRVGI